MNYSQQRQIAADPSRSAAAYAQRNRLQHLMAMQEGKIGASATRDRLVARNSLDQISTRGEQSRLTINDNASNNRLLSSLDHKNKMASDRQSQGFLTSNNNAKWDNDRKDAYIKSNRDIFNKASDTARIKGVDLSDLNVAQLDEDGRVTKGAQSLQTQAEIMEEGALFE